MRKGLAVLVLILCLPAVAFCLDDGFGPSKIAKGAHFAAFYAPQLDPSELARGLDSGPASGVLSSNTGSGLSDVLDALFSRVCDILDMQLYSYEGTIKVCRDRAQLDEVFNVIFRAQLNTESFYVPETNTIYISASSFNPWVLGHEIGHAVIQHYFVVAPPVKIAEILAGYVEYQLRKK